MLPHLRRQRISAATHARPSLPRGSSSCPRGLFARLAGPAEFVLVVFSLFGMMAGVALVGALLGG